MSESTITVTIYSLTACDMDYSDRHVPYVNSVNWDDGILTITQSTLATVPGVSQWLLPGGAAEGDRHVTRYPITSQYGQYGYGQPCKVIFWVEVPHE